MSNTSHASRGRCRADCSPGTPILQSLSLAGELIDSSFRLIEFLEGIEAHPIVFALSVLPNFPFNLPVTTPRLIAIPPVRKPILYRSNSRAPDGNQVKHGINIIPAV